MPFGYPTPPNSTRAGEHPVAVDAVSDTPTDARDYAALNLTFVALLGGVAASRRARENAEGIELRELAPLGAATFALSKAVTREKVTTWAREPFVEEEPGGERRPRGRHLRYAMGELLTCTRCVGTWSALGIVGLRASSPRAGRLVTAVLTASAINDFLQAGFRLICDRADASARDPAPSDRAAGRTGPLHLAGRP